MRGRAPVALHLPLLLAAPPPACIPHSVKYSILPAVLCTRANSLAATAFGGDGHLGVDHGQDDRRQADLRHRQARSWLAGAAVLVFACAAWLVVLIPDAGADIAPDLLHQPDR